MKHLITFLLLLCCTSAYPQRSNSFASALQKYNLEFNSPKGYIEVDTSFSIVNGKSGHTTARAVFALKSKNGKILVGIAFQGPIDTSLKNVFKKSDGTLWDPNKNYIPFRELFVAYPERCAEKYFNADAAGTWKMTPSQAVPVLNREERCKVLVFHKENTVDVEIYHFYSNVSEKKFNQHFKRTRSILRFRNSK